MLWQLVIKFILITSVPSVTCKANDVANMSHGDSLILNNMTYFVIEMDPPQSGVRKLYLSEDRP